MDELLVFSLYECEHHGDLDTYLDDIKQVGGRVQDTETDFEDEEATVTVLVPCRQTFIEALREFPDTFGMSSLDR
jgi:hypothetical protein